MEPEIYWVNFDGPGRLAVMPRPRGRDLLEGEIAGLRSSGVDILVSLLTTEEIDELGLEEESLRCATYGIEFINFPIRDRSVPSTREAALDLARRLAGRLMEGRHVALHCRMGVGRAPLLASCILVAAGLTPDDACARISAARGLQVPETREQRDWLFRGV